MITGPNKKTVSNCIKSFWDTDFESDMEERNVTPWKSRKCAGKEIEKDTICNNTMINIVNKKNNPRGTVLTIRSLQNKTINSSMKSDISRVSKKTVIQENEKSDNNIIAKNSESNKGSQTNKNLSKDTKNKKFKPTKKDNEGKLENENIRSKTVQTKNKATKKENINNTSRNSLRLKEKNERKSKENEDPVKLNKQTGRNNKSNNKNKNNNNNNIKNNNNNKTVTSSVKKNNTIKKTPKKKQQTKNLFATPVTDSSFNISNRSLRVRHKKFIQL